ncbi:hypothetical protein D3C85_1319980 [compost metagenome]
MLLDRTKIGADVVQRRDRRGAALVFAADHAGADLGAIEQHVTGQRGTVVTEAAAGQAGEGARAAALGVIRGGNAPGLLVPADHGGPLAALRLVRRILASAVRAGRAWAGVGHVAAKAVRAAHGQAAEGALVRDGVVGARVRDVAVHRTGAERVRPEDVRVEHGPEQHGVLAAERDLAPFAAQADQRLAPEQAPALVGGARIRREAGLPHEDALQAAAESLGAAQAPA